MEWVIVAAVGAIIGTLFSIVASSARMPQSMCVVLGTVGALLGGALFHITHLSYFGGASFYVFGALLSFGLLAGGLLAYSLTNSEKRI